MRLLVAQSSHGLAFSAGIAHDGNERFVELRYGRYSDPAGVPSADDLNWAEWFHHDWQ